MLEDEFCFPESEVRPGFNMLLTSPLNMKMYMSTCVVIFAEFKRRPKKLRIYQRQCFIKFTEFLLTHEFAKLSIFIRESRIISSKCLKCLELQFFLWPLAAAPITLKLLDLILMLLSQWEHHFGTDFLDSVMAKLSGEPNSSFKNINLKNIPP